MKTSEDNDVFGKLDLEMKDIPVWGACLVDLFWLYAPEKTWLRWLVPESTALEEGPVFLALWMAFFLSVQRHLLQLHTEPVGTMWGCLHVIFQLRDKFIW